MNITTRTCTSYANFNPEPTGLDPACWVKVLFPAGASQREPRPTDCCELHSTSEEAAQAIAAAYATDPRLKEIVRRQLAGENELKHIANQAATQEITGQVLGKLRKGGTVMADHEIMTATPRWNTAHEARMQATTISTASRANPKNAPGSEVLTVISAPG
ncbi:MAG: hypothetical protein PHQ58_20650 [Rhodoferax sp.]|uniref:hypothetical protein n=1 Tax=Rhodoferax sp. TaxID=50421 RepID=UPI0026077E86|nr:hypothetical protein [Rhodoferax sp.]MDD2882830.1 hypothetical protein [Rhodoferax sp.]